MRAWIFDIDGVLTNIDERKITNPQILPYLGKILERKEPLAIMSGRAMQWIIQRVLFPLEEYIKDKQSLNTLFLSGEFGGVYGWYQHGERKIFIQKTLAIPDDLRDDLHHAVQTFQPYVFEDIQKQTHFTVERQYACPPDVFSKHQPIIGQALQKIVQAHHMENTIHVHEDRLAVNVKHIQEKKENAMQAFLDWLEKNQLIVDHYVAFGDSASDSEIGQALQENHLPFAFVFVGKRNLLEKKQFSFPITFTKKLFDEGTVEFLEKNLS